MSAVTLTRGAEICARLVVGQRYSTIAREMGIGHKTVTKAAEVLRSHGVAVPALEHVNAERSAREARLARLHELFQTTTLSNRAISRREGVAVQTVNCARRKWNAERAAEGLLDEECPCGRKAQHRGMCKERMRKLLRSRGVVSVSTLPAAVREEIRQRVLAGEKQNAVGDHFGVPWTNIQSFIRGLSQEDRETRRRAIATKVAINRARGVASTIQRPQSLDPRKDPLFDRIARHVPLSLDKSLRDDAIGSLYLMYLEGDLSEDDLPAKARKVVSNLFNSFANRWGNLSLDVPISDDSTLTYADILPESAGLYA